MYYILSGSVLTKDYFMKYHITILLKCSHSNFYLYMYIHIHTYKYTHIYINIYSNMHMLTKTSPSITYNRMGKTRDLFKKLEITREHFMQR